MPKIFENIYSNACRKIDVSFLNQSIRNGRLIPNFDLSACTEETLLQIIPTSPREYNFSNTIVLFSDNTIVLFLTSGTSII